MDSIVKFVQIDFFISETYWQGAEDQDAFARASPRSFRDRIKQWLGFTMPELKAIENILGPTSTYVHEGILTARNYHSFSQNSDGFKTVWLFHDTLAYIQSLYSSSSRNTGSRIKPISSKAMTMDHMGAIHCDLTYHTDPKGVEGVNPYNGQYFCLESFPENPSRYTLHLQENSPASPETSGLFYNYLMFLLMNIRKMLYYRRKIGLNRDAIQSVSRLNTSKRKRQAINKYSLETLPKVLETIGICLRFSEKILYDLQIDSRWLEFCVTIKEECHKLASQRKDQESFRYITDELDLEDLLAKGETAKVEFKASFSKLSEEDIADLRSKVPDTVFEETLRKKEGEVRQKVLKAIIGMMNRNGGTILLGINDNGEPVGMDLDYEAYPKGAFKLDPSILDKLRSPPKPKSHRIKKQYFQSEEDLIIAITKIFPDFDPEKEKDIIEYCKQSSRDQFLKSTVFDTLLKVTQNRLILSLAHLSLKDFKSKTIGIVRVFPSSEAIWTTDHVLYVRLGGTRAEEYRGELAEKYINSYFRRVFR